MKKIALFLAFFAFCGCEAPFLRTVEGTDTLIGVSIPNEEVLQFEALHYLSGSKLTIRNPAYVKYEYTTCQTNSYFGMIETQTYRKSGMEVNPFEGAMTNRFEKAEK